MPLTPYTLEGKYFLQTTLDLDSCHDQVVSRVIPLMLNGPLIVQIMMSVTRQVVQVGLCMGMTRTRCNKRVFLLGRSASTGEAGLSSVFWLYSLVGMYLSAGRYLHILREAVFPLGVFLFQYGSFLCYFFFKILVSACFSIQIS